MFHPQFRSTYVFAGPLRWVEPDGRRAVLRVDAAAGHARRFCGRSVTLDLGECRRIQHLAGDALKPGEMVTVKARLPKRLHDLPSVVSPRSVLALGPML